MKHHPASPSAAQSLSQNPAAGRPAGCPPWCVIEHTAPHSSRSHHGRRRECAGEAQGFTVAAFRHRHQFLSCLMIGFNGGEHEVLAADAHQFAMLLDSLGHPAIADVVREVAAEVLVETDAAVRSLAEQRARAQ